MSFDNKYSGHGLVSAPIVANLEDDSNKDATGDYSGEDNEVTFAYGAATPARIFWMNIAIGDTALVAAGYGALAALTEGIQVYHWDGSSATVLTGEDKIKNHVDWLKMPGMSMKVLDMGAGDDLIVFHWDFVKGFGSPIRLASASESLALEVNDSFTGLTFHQFMVGGCFETSAPAGS